MTSLGNPAVLDTGATPHWVEEETKRVEALPKARDYIEHARRNSGRGLLDMLREYFALARGRGKLGWPDYVKYGLYDNDRFSAEDKARFISERIHWPVINACCDTTWRAATEDKWLASRIMAGSGIRQPETVAVVDRSRRSYPGVPKLSTSEALRDFLAGRDRLPLFGKLNEGLRSHGVIRIEAADAAGVEINGQGRFDYQSFMEQILGDTAFLLQRVECNHPDLERFADALATVRICVLRMDSAVTIPFAVLKLPAHGNVADNFWRPGNLVCNLDTASGEILNVRGKGAIEPVELTEHPVSGEAMVGQRVPMWAEVVATALAASDVFDPIRYQSMDIAVTQEGPVLIEINSGGSFELIQLARGAGFLTDEVIELFKSCQVPGF